MILIKALIFLVVLFCLYEAVDGIIDGEMEWKEFFKFWELD